jgi:hypothetical protein
LAEPVGVKIFEGGKHRVGDSHKKAQKAQKAQKTLVPFVLFCG